MMTIHGDQAENINWLSQLPLATIFFVCWLIGTRRNWETGDGCDRVPFEKKKGEITNKIQLLIHLEFVGVERIGGDNF